MGRHETIAATKKSIAHCVGNGELYRYELSIKETSRNNSACLSVCGANVYLHCLDRVTCQDGEDVFIWLVCGHHDEETAKAIAKIEESINYIDSLNEYRIRATTQKESSGYRPVIIKEKLNKRSQTWGCKKVLLAGLEVCKNRNVTNDFNVSAETIARRLVKEFYPVQYFEGA